MHVWVRHNCGLDAFPLDVAKRVGVVKADGNHVRLGFQNHLYRLFEYGIVQYGNTPGGQFSVGTLYKVKTCPHWGLGDVAR
jgi:hypothetical protein